MIESAMRSSVVQLPHSTLIASPLNPNSEKSPCCNSHQLIDHLYFMEWTCNPSVAAHCQRVGEYAGHIAQELGFSEDEVLVIKDAGLLHDIGKIEIPENILTKPGPLTKDERKIMETHPLLGYKFLHSFSLPKIISNIALSHHERNDGSGYPDSLHEEKIPFEARIVAVADTFDAMTSDRPYRREKYMTEALQNLRDLPDLFDRNVVQALSNALDGHLDYHGYKDQVPYLQNALSKLFKVLPRELIIAAVLYSTAVTNEHQPQELSNEYSDSK